MWSVSSREWLRRANMRRQPHAEAAIAIRRAQMQRRLPTVTMEQTIMGTCTYDIGREAAGPECDRCVRDFAYWTYRILNQAGEVH